MNGGRFVFVLRKTGYAAEIENFRGRGLVPSLTGREGMLRMLTGRYVVRPSNRRLSKLKFGSAISSRIILGLKNSRGEVIGMLFGGWWVGGLYVGERFL